MLDVAPSELLLIAVVALVVIGPKDLPRVMRVVGQWMGRARGVARHFRSGIDEMIRQSELDEMQKKWAEENARIMSQHPMAYRPEIEGQAQMTQLAPEPGAPALPSPASAPPASSSPASSSPAQSSEVTPSGERQLEVDPSPPAPKS